MHARQCLLLGASLSLFLGVFHVPFLFLGEAAARFFSAPPLVLRLVREHSPWLCLVVLVVLGVFGLFGAYGLSGAGKIRRLPLLRFGLVAVAAIYTLRGLVFPLELRLVMLNPEKFPPQKPVFSLIALGVGVLYWVGLRGLWHELSRCRSDGSQSRV